jgi:group I intron endonuclease
MESPTEWIPLAKTPRNGGIYQIHCIPTGESYVGMTTGSLQRRLHFQHRADLRKGRHFNRRLQEAWNKYGEPAFASGILEDMPGTTAAKIAERERHWIARLGTFMAGFNQSEGGEAPALGYRFTPEQREKMSRSHKGKTRTFTEEHKANIQKARAGKKLSPEHRAKIAEAGKGRTATEETRGRLRVAQKARPPRKPLTMEHRAKISAAMTGKKKGPRRAQS